MIIRFLIPLLALAFVLLSGPSSVLADPMTSAAWQRLQLRSADTLRALSRPSSTVIARSDAVQLSFDQFFEPVGDEGLRFTEAAKSRAGQTVCISGFMLRETSRIPGVFVLVARAGALDANERCTDTEIPPHAIYVHAPGPARIPFVPGPLLLTGTLEIGHQVERNGRNSWIRLRLDAAPFGSGLPSSTGANPP